MKSPPRTTSEFVTLLRREREIVEVSAPVDPRLEVAEIHRRVIDRGGPALLFTQVKGSQFPVVTNLFGTPRRVHLAFGSKPERIMAAMARYPETLIPPNLGKLWKHKDSLTYLLRTGLSRRRASNDLIIDTPPRLTRLPLLTTWPLDGGPFITLPLVYTEHPEKKMHNLGMYRIQRYDDATTGLHCQIGKGGGFHLAVAKERGERLPVNVFVGGPPALVLAAIAPLPENVPELLFSSFVMGRKLPFTDSPVGPLPLLPEVDFTLVGEVDPRELRPEGPFGDHYGYYSLQHDYPVFRCKALVRRPDAIYPATVVGKPRQEDFFIGEYLQKLLAPLFPLVMPQVVDLWSYGETGFHALASAVVKERYGREMLVSGFRILGEGQLSLTKFLLLMDKEMDLTNFRAVLSHVLARADFRSDLYIFSNTAMDTLDYAGPEVNKGSKGMLLGRGGPIRELPREIPREPLPGITDVKVFCPGCLVVSGASYQQDITLPQHVANLSSLAAWPLVVLVDDAERATESTQAFLWNTFTRFEPAADIHPARTEQRGHHLSYTPPIVIDARMKPWYPGEVEVDEETAERVTARWGEYFPTGSLIDGSF
jgi:UbiD family decarboxylase